VARYHLETQARDKTSYNCRSMQCKITFASFIAGAILQEHVSICHSTGTPVLFPARFHRSGSPTYCPIVRTVPSIAIFYTPDMYVSILGDTNGYLLFKLPGSSQFSFRSMAEQLNRSSGKVSVDKNIPTTIKSYVAASAMPSPD
jgi:hypothetical protein